MDLAITDAEERALGQVVLDPVRFCRGNFAYRPWRIQREIMRSIAVNPLTAVKACHASGKTSSAANVAAWWCARYEDSLVLTTAPTWRQVKLMWSEIRHAVRHDELKIFPEPSSTGIKIVDGAGRQREMLGISTNDPQKFRGYHARHVLVLVDEATGVMASIWDEIEGIRSGGHVHVAIFGNPTVASGKFHDAHEGRERSIWNRFTISAFDTPNFAGIDSVDALMALTDDQAAELMKHPYLITPAWVRERFRVWGPGHPSFVSRVLGQFPDQDPYSLYSALDLAAADVEVDTSQLRTQPGVLAMQVGIDVAGPGDDETVLVARMGRFVLQIKAYPHDPAGDYRGAILRDLRELERTWRGIPIGAIVVDATGIGHNLALQISDSHKDRVFLNNNGARAMDSERFENLKAEQYWGVRDRLRQRRILGITDDETRSQALGIRYSETPAGRIEIESKDRARKRGVTQSPDRWEALVLAFAPIVPRTQEERYDPPARLLAPW